MNAMLIFLLIIAPILHHCNSADDETHDYDVLRITIKNDWQNMPGYEFLGKLTYAKHRFNVQLFHKIPPYFPPIGPSQVDSTDPHADVFYFRIEKKYKVEELGVRIGVAKYGASSVASQYEQIILRKKVGEISILPGGETQQIATIPTHRQERSEGKIQNEGELDEEIDELERAEIIASVACREDALRCLERRWAGFYIGMRKNEKKEERLKLKRQSSHISVENLRREEIALHQENINLEKIHQNILDEQNKLMLQQFMASFAKQTSASHPTITTSGSTIGRNYPLNSGYPIAAVPLRAIASEETILHRDMGKGPASSATQKERESKVLWIIQFGWVRRYYFEINSNPDGSECHEIAKVLQKRNNQIVKQFKYLQGKYRITTEMEHKQKRNNRDQFMEKMRQGFAKQLEEEKKRKGKTQIAAPSPAKDKETHHMEKGKGKRPASSSAEEEQQPKRKARTSFSKKETAWLFWYRDHVIIYTSFKPRKEVEEIAEVLRRIEPLRTANELLTWFHNHRSHKDLIEIEEELRQKLHEAFMAKMRAEFPNKPEEGALLPSIDDLHASARMDETD